MVPQVVLGTCVAPLIHVVHDSLEIVGAADCTWLCGSWWLLQRWITQPGADGCVGLLTGLASCSALVLMW